MWVSSRFPAGRNIIFFPFVSTFPHVVAYASRRVVLHSQDFIIYCTKNASKVHADRGRHFSSVR